MVLIQETTCTSVVLQPGVNPRSTSRHFLNCRGNWCPPVSSSTSRKACSLTQKSRSKRKASISQSPNGRYKIKLSHRKISPATLSHHKSRMLPRPLVVFALGIQLAVIAMVRGSFNLLFCAPFAAAFCVCVCVCVCVCPSLPLHSPLSNLTHTRTCLHQFRDIRNTPRAFPMDGTFVKTASSSTGSAMSACKVTLSQKHAAHSNVSHSHTSVIV